MGLLIILSRSLSDDIRTNGSAEVERDERFEEEESPSGEAVGCSASLVLRRPGVGGRGRIGRGAIAGRGSVVGFAIAGEAGMVNNVEVTFEFPLLEKLLRLLLGSACE